jgi:hypothetical protein
MKHRPRHLSATPTQGGRKRPLSFPPCLSTSKRAISTEANDPQLPPLGCSACARIRCPLLAAETSLLPFLRPLPEPGCHCDHHHPTCPVLLVGRLTMPRGPILGARTEPPGTSPPFTRRVTAHTRHGVSPNSQACRSSRRTRSSPRALHRMPRSAQRRRCQCYTSSQRPSLPMHSSQPSGSRQGAYPR